MELFNEWLDIICNYNEETNIHLPNTGSPQKMFQYVWRHVRKTNIREMYIMCVHLMNSVWIILILFIVVYCMGDPCIGIKIPVY